MNKERLLKLADHLRNGKLGHKHFDFGVFNTNSDNAAFFCGTAGCALGECPIIWPDEWVFCTGGMVSWIHCSVPDDPFGSAEEFFDLSIAATAGLFSPGFQGLIGFKNLHRSATKEEVAELIENFVAMKEEAA